MVATLAESAVEQGRTVLIVTSQNSAADSAIEKLKNSEYMIVRAHSLGLERWSMLRSQKESEEHKPEYAAQKSKDTARPAEPTDDKVPEIVTQKSKDTEPPTDPTDAEVPDEQLEDIILRANIDYMQMCEELYVGRESVPRRDDPRMQKVQFATSQ